VSTAPSPASTTSAGAVERLVASKEVLVACGPGGVGKTTVAAAIAATAAARLEARVLVVTVDPARRLADALGMSGIGNRAVEVDRLAFQAAGAEPRGSLFAAMLDGGESWDGLVRRHAPDRATAEQIVSNPLYQNLTRRFAQSQDYIAMERLHEIHETGEYDLVVVDTPPTSNALDFLDAADRMGEFFSSRLLRWLTVPYRSRLVNIASRPFYQIADRILGTQFLQDVAEFFILFQTMRDGFLARAAAVHQLLRDLRTSFVVVTTLEAAPVREAQGFVDALRARRLHLGLLVCNRVLPASLTSPAAAAVAEELGRRAAELVSEAAALDDRLAGVEPGVVMQVLSEVSRSFGDFRRVAQREAELFAELGALHEARASVPYLPGHVTDLAGLLTLGARIWGAAEPAPSRRRGAPRRSAATGPRARDAADKEEPSP
jgi:anion-transporting  ArsA/GET3 family ATPase